MKIALAQIVPKLGDVEANVELHLDILGKARRQKAGLVVFPELGLTGYTLKDLVEEVALDPASDPLFRQARRRHEGPRGRRRIRRGKPRRQGPVLQRGRFHRRRPARPRPSQGLPADGRPLRRGQVLRPGTRLPDVPGAVRPGRIAHLPRLPPIRLELRPLRGRRRPDHLHLGRARDAASAAATLSRRAGCGSSWARPSPTFRRPSSSTPTASAVEDGVTFAGGSFVFAPGRAARRPGPPRSTPSSWSAPSTSPPSGEARRRWLFKRDEKPEAVWRSLERIVRASED